MAEAENAARQKQQAMELLGAMQASGQVAEQAGKAVQAFEGFQQ